MRIYLLMAHPDRASFNGALADAYEQAALARGHQVRRQDLGDLRFDPILWKGYDTVQPLEPDLLQAQENIRWCEKWVIVFPVWWGSVPALLKGFFDRTLLPGFAFRPHDADAFWDKLLGGRSAHLVTTSDAPALYLWWRYGDSDVKAVRRATLEFCGVRPVRTTRIGRVRFLSADQRNAWLKRIAALA